MIWDLAGMASWQARRLMRTVRRMFTCPVPSHAYHVLECLIARAVANGHANHVDTCHQPALQYLNLEGHFLGVFFSVFFRNYFCFSGSVAFWLLWLLRWFL